MAYMVAERAFSLSDNLATCASKDWRAVRSASSCAAKPVACDSFPAASRPIAGMLAEPRIVELDIGRSDGGDASVVVVSEGAAKG